MRNIKKILLIALTVCVLLGATPAFAQLLGTWEGTGRGNCHPPGYTIYPWQTWKGEVYVSEDEAVTIFEGEWYDADGNHGKFKGRMVPSPIPEERHFKGYWTWDHPSSVSKKAGDFHMVFYFLEGYCKGTWTSIYPSTSAQGTMKGRKVE